MAIKRHLLGRREFLQAGAGAAASLGLSSPASAILKSIGTQDTVSAPLTLAFWLHNRFVDARRIAPALTTPERMQVTIRSYGEGGPLASIDFVSRAKANDGVREFPFKAWVAPPAGGERASFVFPVHPVIGLTLLVHQRIDGQDVSQRLSLGSRVASDAPLRDGLYLLAGGRADLTSFEYMASSSSGRFVLTKTWNRTSQFVSIDLEVI